ncbi:hypothetical protein TWF694_008768 [Orbilia ellipsospora]|uniref:Rhodanese domain-containing protein n=1 Tax=Orbilia ellipsospora TaxID=2528407 RepID=A0AAV9XCW5_9PEZI
MAATSPNRIVIIGGVAGGMSSATRLRRLNEQFRITVIEKDSYISSATCGLPYALGGVIEDREKLHVQSADKISAWFNIDIMTNTEAVEIHRESKQVAVRAVKTDGSHVDENVHRLSYDKLIIATGAEAIYPKIEGIHSENVFTLRTISDLEHVQAYMANHQVKHVAVIGGGFIGLEAVENLVNLGLDVTLLEYLPQVMPNIDVDIAEFLHSELISNGVKLSLDARIVKIHEPKPSAQGYVSLSSGEQIAADIVILAAGIQPRTELAEKAGLVVSRSGIDVHDTLQTSDPDIYAIGDVIGTTNIISNETRNLALGGPANRQGRLAADHISGRLVRYRGHTGTFVCQVFNLTVAAVGLNPNNLNRLCKKFEYVTVHPPDHAAYYPGATPITLRVAFDASSGKLFGAQAVGKKGVDKRIDVIATAIRAGMTVGDLQDLELAYAPPYASAKDPINMAGFVGTNVVIGDVKILHPSTLEKLRSPQIIDVRSPEEYGRGYIKGAVNIPLGDLRQRCEELSKAKRTLVYCHVGYRGYLAYRILKQHGFEHLFNLDGGYKLVSEGGFRHLTTLQ